MQKSSFAKSAREVGSNLVVIPLGVGAGELVGRPLASGLVMGAVGAVIVAIARLIRRVVGGE